MATQTCACVCGHQEDSVPKIFAHMRNSGHSGFTTCIGGVTRTMSFGKAPASANAASPEDWSVPLRFVRPPRAEICLDDGADCSPDDLPAEDLAKKRSDALEEEMSVVLVTNS